MGITGNVGLKYKVYDSLGNFMRKFPTYKQAVTYRLAYGNKCWMIKYKH